MKILFLANRVPYPPYRGDKLKIWNLAKQLHGKHELHLLTFAQSLEEMKYAESLKTYFHKVELIYLPKWKSLVTSALGGPFCKIPLQVLYFQSAEMHAALARLLSRNAYDAVHVQHLRMAPYLADNKVLPRILDLPDAFSLYWKRRQDLPGGGGIRKVFEQIEQKRLLRYEAVVKKFNLSLACSAEDVNYLREIHHADNIELLPNGVDLKAFSPKRMSYTEDKMLLFTGNMDYAPNVDAVIHFVKNIFPGILKACPRARFVIAGQRPVQQVKDLASDKIEVTGFVKDLSELYDKAAIVVAPLRFGAGTQNKVLEAMAMGVPVVSTNIGFEGLGIQSGEGVFRETTDESFTQRVCELLSSESLRGKTGSLGNAVAKSRYGWEAVAARLEGYFERIISEA